MSTLTTWKIGALLVLTDAYKLLNQDRMEVILKSDGDDDNDNNDDCGDNIRMTVPDLSAKLTALSPMMIIMVMMMMMMMMMMIMMIMIMMVTSSKTKKSAHAVIHIRVSTTINNPW
jgi:hypothetical protein